MRKILRVISVFVMACGVATGAVAQQVGTLDLVFSSSASVQESTSAADAAEAMARFIDSASGGMSSTELLAALKDAAEAGQTMALWRLGNMYENGEGVPEDRVRAFGYFSRIANEHANTPPRSLQADIVAHSFVKVGEYYRKGLPDAGVEIDSDKSNMLLLHAASYFGDADAQYRVGRLFLSEGGLGMNALQSARWLSLSARKGHVAAQATLGDMLFSGDTLERQPVEGLMWLTIASQHASGSSEESWVVELLNKAMSVATPDERSAALHAAETLGGQFSG